MTSREHATNRSNARAPSSAAKQAAPPAPLHHLLQLQSMVGNRAVTQLLAREQLPQTKLKVSHPGSEPEREADQAADTIATGSFQQSRAHGTPAPVRSISNTPGRGGQPLESGVRAAMESGFGVDFTHVRVHRDAGADRAASALNARAFTVGGDVAFASGEYQADTAAGRRLLAHELAHVVQQAGGSPAGANLPGLHAAAPSVQRYVRTMGGEWDTTKYDIMKTGTVENGVDIVLNFKPEDPVNAELIGLTQTASTYSGGSPVFPTDTVKNRSIPSGESGEGAHIDRLSAYGNPLYAAEKPAAGDTLAATPTDTVSWGQHGWHYSDATGAHHQDAILKDTPQLDPPGKNAHQTFETTALAVKGAQEGTYYGSVSWGWKTDDAGVFTQLPLAIASAGVPTSTFMDAARLWNTNPTSEGKATIGLPISTLSSTTKLPSSYSTSELILRIAQLNRELAITFIPTDKTNKQFEKTALEFELKKRADQPTVSLADQEKAADLLPTADLIKRANALPMEIAVMAPSPARTDRQLEQEAVNRAIKKRTMIVIVHVHDTNDVFSDNVYVVASTLFAGYWKSDVVDLNDGQENKWMVPLSDVFPVAGLQPDLAPVIVQAYDEDIISADDLMFGALWLWSELPKVETQEMSGGKYTVRVDLT